MQPPQMDFSFLLLPEETSFAKWKGELSGVFYTNPGQSVPSDPEEVQPAQSLGEHGWFLEEGDLSDS